jgi:hypothetical protein
MQNPANHYSVIFLPNGTSWNNGQGGIWLTKVVADKVSTLGYYHAPNFLSIGESVPLSVSATGSLIIIRFKGAEVLRATDSTYTAGRIGFGIKGDPTQPSDATFANITVEEKGKQQEKVTREPKEVQLKPRQEIAAATPFLESVSLELIACGSGHSLQYPQVRGYVPRDIDLGTESNVNAIFEKAKKFAQERCPSGEKVQIIIILCQNSVSGADCKNVQDYAVMATFHIYGSQIHNRIADAGGLRQYEEKFRLQQETRMRELEEKKVSGREAEARDRNTED